MPDRWFWVRVAVWRLSTVTEAFRDFLSHSRQFTNGTLKQTAIFSCHTLSNPDEICMKCE
jgi:hypothetical protein